VEVAPLFRRATVFGKYKVYIWRSIAVLFTGVTAMTVPKFGLFINLVGSVACTILAFIVPVLCYDKAFENELTKEKRYLHMALCVIGAIGGGLSFYVSCQNIVLAFGDEDKSHGLHQKHEGKLLM